jgi:hypothetical protein
MVLKIRPDGGGEEITCKALPDSGASRCIIDAGFVKRLGCKPDPAGAVPINAANGTSVPCTGNILLTIGYDSARITVDALVSTALTEEMLFSFADLGRLGVLPPGYPRKQFPAENELEFQDDYLEDDYLSAEMFAIVEGFEQEIPTALDPVLEALCEEFADVFDSSEVTAMEGAPMQIHLRRSDPKYKPCKMYRARLIPHHWEEEADKTIQWFLDSGVVVKVPTSEPTEWCSPGFFVKKKEGANKVRLVVDYRQLNKFVDRQAHPFQSPRDIVKGIK